MHTSGRIFELYDDSKGEVFRSLFPTPADVPETVKTAHALSVEERQQLPDDVFALVVVDGADKLRKYACTDAGNTQLSIAYFLNAAPTLPEAVVKTAAMNLLTACEWYGVSPPEELEKIAVLGRALKFVGDQALSNPLGTLQKAVTYPAVAQGVRAEQQARGSVSAQAGGNIMTPHQVHETLGRKVAELSGTPVMPLTDPVNKKPGEHKSTIKVGNYFLPPVVAPADPVRFNDREVSCFALPGQYPLDSYAQVKSASAFFDANLPFLAVEERREFSKNLVKRAEALGIETSHTAKKYASEVFAPLDEMKLAFAMRRNLLESQPDSLRVLDGFEELVSEPLDKQASIECTAVVCSALRAFDEATGLDHHYDQHLSDPYYSLLGVEKQAEDEATFSWTEANDYVTGPHLRRLARTGRKTLAMVFGEDFAKEFCADPIAIFKSVPLQQKKILARMGEDTITPVELGL